MIYKTLHRKLRFNPNKETPLKTGSELMCVERVGSSCSMCGIRLVTNPVIGYAQGKDRIVIMTNRTYRGHL